MTAIDLYVVIDSKASEISEIDSLIQILKKNKEMTVYKVCGVYDVIVEVNADGDTDKAIESHKRIREAQGFRNSFTLVAKGSKIDSKKFYESIYPAAVISS